VLPVAVELASDVQNTSKLCNGVGLGDGVGVGDGDGLGVGVGVGPGVAMFDANTFGLSPLALVECKR